MTDPPAKKLGVPSEERSLKLAEFLPYRLNVLASLASEGLAKVYFERFGINIPAWRVLVTVAEFRSITPTKVAKHSFMTKVKVSRAVAQLEDMGLVIRTANIEDNRETHLKLTVTGESIFREIEPLALGFSERLFSVLSPGERLLLDEMISRLTSAALSREHLSHEEGWE